VKQIGLAVLFLFCFADATYCQEQPPRLLIHAAHCLAVKDMFPSSKAIALTFGYFLDENSYPGEKVLYVVDYAAPKRSNGFVFTIVLAKHEDDQVFNIQNNASFVLSKGDIHGVRFVDPPLGGEWTQERLASAIERIETQPRFRISAKGFLAVDTSIRCESYTDPQK
jgi:hypothetical protein